MKSFEEFSIPISGLDDGLHRFDFQLNREFFEGFEKSAISDGLLNATVDLDKRSSMLLFDIDIDGRIAEKCDRCLADIQLPISGHYQLIGKYGEGEEDLDVFYLSREDTEINIARFLYELSCLTVPLSKTYDCENDEDPPCDESMLDDIEEEDESSTRLGDELSKLNLDN